MKYKIKCTQVCLCWKVLDWLKLHWGWLLMKKFLPDFVDPMWNKLAVDCKVAAQVTQVLFDEIYQWILDNLSPFCIHQNLMQHKGAWRHSECHIIVCTKKEHFATQCKCCNVCACLRWFLLPCFSVRFSHLIFNDSRCVTYYHVSWKLDKIVWHTKQQSGNAKRAE